MRFGLILNDLLHLRHLDLLSYKGRLVKNDMARQSQARRMLRFAAGRWMHLWLSARQRVKWRIGGKVR